MIIYHVIEKKLPIVELGRGVDVGELGILTPLCETWAGRIIHLKLELNNL